MLVLMACTVAGPKPGDTAETADSAVESGEDSTAETDSGHDSGSDTGGDSDTSGDTDTAPTPTDADGDGHATIEEGGDDCDDDDATTYPGAEEWCDLVDHDCDGEPLAPGVCAKIQEPGAIETRIESHLDPYINVTAYQVIGDLNGDGIGELYVSCWQYCGYGYRSYQILPGGIPAVPLEVPISNLETWYLVSGDYGGQQAEAAGDVNGDGVEDLAFIINDASRGVFVDYGPFDLDGANHELIDASDAWYRSEPPHDGTGWGYPYIAGLDFDGDGRSDFAVAPAFGDTDEVQVDIFFGGSAGDEYTRLVGPGAEPVKMPDLDGDGLAELWINAVEPEIGDPGWISGADLRGADGALADDLLAGVWEGEFGSVGVPTLGSALWRCVGDWDGDGYAELAAGSRAENTAYDPTAEIVFFGGDLTGRHSIDDAVGRMDGGEGCSVRYPCNTTFDVADYDGDGVLDIVSDRFDVDVYRSAYFVYPGRRGIPLPGANYADGTLSWYTDQGRLYPGDVDADGYDDILGEFTGLGDVAAVRGWEVPWDDPTYW